MSKKSYALIFIMLAALIYMGAARGYQFYQQKVAEWEQERQSAEGAFSFQNVPVSLAAPRAEPMPAPVLFQGTKEDLFIEEKPLSKEEAEKQAVDTIHSILADFSDEEHLQKFNEELTAVSGGKALNISSLSGKNLGQLMQQNPEIAGVVSKHMQNPDFAKTVQQIFTNPQFLKSIEQLQGSSKNAPQPLKKDE
jgi:hypothetical protein